MISFPRLELLFGAYLDEDYEQMYGDHWGALSAMVSAAPELVGDFQDEIRTLLSERRSEPDLAAFIDSTFEPSIDVHYANETWREWLQKMSDEAGRLAAHPGAA